MPFLQPAIASPSPGEVRALRKAARLTQTEAGKLVHVGLRAWQQWEAGERSMHSAFWELFIIKTATRTVHIIATQEGSSA